MAEKTDRAAYAAWLAVPLRYSDQDPMGHVNNVAYAAYVAEGRTTYLNGLLGEFPHPGIDFVLASLRIDYRKELLYPGVLDVGTCVLRLGTSSVTLGHGLFKGDVLNATAESVVVFIDVEKGGSTPIPEDIRGALDSAKS